MKYNELMDKIYWHWRRDLRGADGLKPMLDYRSALLAVVELHKPIKDEWFNVGEIICEECTREEYTTKYPCNTIQSIEKELN